MAKVTAIIDIGSNSARIAIFRRTSRYGFYLVEEHKSRMRISENSYHNGGVLQQAAIERALSTLRGFLKIAQELGARKILCVATSAVRDAPNKSEFVSLVRSCLGLSVKVISGEKEAFYGAVAASNLLPYPDGITIDIGGGSCECAHIVGGKIETLTSLNIGTIRLKELFFDKNAPISEAIAFVKDALKNLPDSMQSVRVFGIGGTIRAISKAIMESQDYPLTTLHAFEYNPQQYKQFYEKIYSATTTQQLEYLGIAEERFDNIRGGALIFSLLLEHFQTQQVVTSGVGVREGVFLSDLLRTCNFTFPRGFNPSLRSLIDRFSIQDSRSKLTASYALRLFDLLQPLHRLDAQYKPHLKTSARLVYIGAALNFYQSHKHSSYFLANGLNYGYTHRDRILIAFLVEFYGGKKPPSVERHNALASLLPDYPCVEWLCALLGIADAVAVNVHSATFELENNTIQIITSHDTYLLREALAPICLPEGLAIHIQWLEA